MRKSTVLILFLTFCNLNISNAQPRPPANLKASVYSWFRLTFVKLTWNAPSSFHGSYYIYKKEGAKASPGVFEKLHEGFRFYSLNSYLDKMVSDGLTYSYFVTAYNRDGESNHSDTVEITLTGSGGTAYVYGKLTDETTGMGLKNGRIEFIPFLEWQFNEFKTDSSGNYSSKINPGNYYAAFLSRGFLPEFYDNVPSIFDATQIQINENDSLRIDAALTPIVKPKQFSLSGKVTDTAGMIVKSKISVFTLNHHFFLNKFRQGRTDSAGNYSVPVREGDTVVVFANPQDRKYLPEFYNNKTDFTEADRIIINGNITDINFLLEEKPVYNNSISGTVKNDSGKTLLANVTLFKLKDPRFINFKKTTMTDSLGNYSFSNIKPGTYILFMIPERGYLPTFFKYDGTSTNRWKDADSIAVTESSQINGINFIAEPVPDSGFGRIAGFIKDGNGESVSGAMVYAIDENSDIAGCTTTDEKGSYSIDNLMPASYSVYADKFNYNSTSQNNISINYSNTLSQNVSLTLTSLSTTSEKEPKTQITDYILTQNYPNPFNPTTVINYQIPEAGWVTLKVYNIIGQEITTLVNNFQAAGSYNVVFDGSKLESGIYFYVLNAGKTTLTRKMVLIK
jgi:hypothetical protein